MFDECYKKERFEVYEYWISVGMAIKNTFLNEINNINASQDELQKYILYNETSM